MLFDARAGGSALAAGQLGVSGQRDHVVGDLRQVTLVGQEAGFAVPENLAGPPAAGGDGGEPGRTGLHQRYRGALALQGFGPPKVQVEDFRIKPRRLRFGAPLKMHIELRAKASGEWMIDYAVHRMLGSGRLAPKVFKWTRRTVKRGERIVLDKDHAIRAISTRRYYPGLHRVEVLVNGKSLAIEDFQLTGVPP